MRKKHKSILSYFHPNVMLHKRPNGEEEYAVHDVFFNESGDAIDWTIEALSPRMPSVQNLKEELIRLLQEKKHSGHEIICGDAGDQTAAADIEFWLEYIDGPPIPWDVQDSDEQLAQIALERETRYSEPRVLLHRTPDGTEEYAIHEVYFNGFGVAIDWTDDALSPRAPSIQDLREELLRLLQEAVPSHTKVVCGDEKQSYSLERVYSWLDATKKEPM